MRRNTHLVPIIVGINMAFRKCLLVIVIALLLSGCRGKSVSTYTVAHDSDRFTEQLNGQTVTYKDWTITIGDKTVEIPHEKSEIKIIRNGKQISIEVNSKLLLEQ